jgi:hypothetical protein
MPDVWSDEDLAALEAQDYTVDSGAAAEYVRDLEAENERLRAQLAVIRDAAVSPTPEMIAAAWGAWKQRHRNRMGPGPGFVEALVAGLAIIAPEVPEDD